jgi:4-aminobutyrate aminotransferase-like enzyme
MVDPARVAEAVARQLIAPDAEIRERYITRLLALLPDPLRVCYLVHSLSEANEIALRIARAHRSGKDVIVTEDSTYGITTSLANMSPGRRKFWVQVASRADASEVAAKARVIKASGRGLCAFFAEGLFQPGYLGEAFASVRDAGGLNVAIETQRMWEFARHQVVPDIVVLGEFLGGGFPLAAVITRRELAAPFSTGSGGSAAACAAGLEVLNAWGI